MKWSDRTLCLGASFILLAFAANSLALEVPAANGRGVPVVGIQNATPAGLEVQIKVGEPVRVIAWDKLDLEKLRQQLPDIYGAFQKAEKGVTVAIDLGTFQKGPAKEPEKTPEGMPGFFPNGKRIPQYKDDVWVTFRKPIKAAANHGDGEAAFGIPLEVSTIKAVIVVLWLDPSRGTDFTIQEAHFLNDYCTENDFAILGINLKHREGADGPTYQNASEGSGQIVLDALEHFAKAFEQPEINTVPLLVAGGTGASAGFAYNFAQWKPERVVAVCSARGAGHVAEPSPEGAKIPTLFLGVSLISLADVHPEDGPFKTYERTRDQNPPWIYAEFPGNLSDSREYEWNLFRQLFDLALKRRVSGGVIGPFDADLNAQMGHRQTFEIIPMTPENRSDPGYCWLPDLAFAKTWSDFQNGILPDPDPNAKSTPDPDNP